MCLWPRPYSISFIWVVAIMVKTVLSAYLLRTVVHTYSAEESFNM